MNMALKFLKINCRLKNDTNDERVRIRTYLILACRKAIMKTIPTIQNFCLIFISQ